MALLLLIFSAIPVSVLGATYAISPGWDILTSSKSCVTGEYPLHNGYYLANNGTMDIVSENGMFALVFDKANPWDGLTVVVRSNSSLVFFIDHVEYQRSSLSSLSSIDLDDCGNAVISYEHYKNNSTSYILSPMCSTKWGLKSKSTGYSARLYDGGLALELEGQVYGEWSLKDAKREFHEDDVHIPKCDGRRAYMEMAKNGSLSLRDGESLEDMGAQPVNSCSILPYTLRFRKVRQDGELVLPFLRMTASGELGLYTLDTKQRNWVVDSVLVLDMVCKSITSCGLDKVCDLNGKCSTSLAMGNTSQGPQDLSYAKQHKLAWTRNGVGYISTRFLKPHLINTSLDMCTQAVHLPLGIDRISEGPTSFYDHKTRACYLMDAFPAGSLHRDDNMTTCINFSYISPHHTYISLKRVWVPIGLVIAAIYLVLTTLAILCEDMKKTGKINPVAEVEALLSTMQGLPQRFTYLEMNDATRGFATKLGAGGFGSVYEGFTKDGRHVAVKKLHDKGTESAKQFVTEIAGIGGVNHYNIVKLCGFCIDGATRKLLVYEFMPNGSLDRWLFSSDSERTLSWEQRSNIALGIARGLFYLHEECSEPILHLDIKPQNILLNGKFEAKVADFGMAKLLASREITHVDTNVRGTPGYMAPEWLLQYAATKKCDIYSYGMLLLELIGGRKNVDLQKINSEDSRWYFPAWVVDRVKENNLLDVMDPKLKGQAPIDDVRMLVRIALWCTQDNPSLRPNMGETLEMLLKHKPVEEPPVSFYFDRAEDLRITCDDDTVWKAVSVLNSRRMQWL